MNPAVALIGKPPAVKGFGAEVASNRGLLVVTFFRTASGDGVAGRVRVS